MTEKSDSGEAKAHTKQQSKSCEQNGIKSVFASVKHSGCPHQGTDQGHRAYGGWTRVGEIPPSFKFHASCETQFKQQPGQGQRW